VLSRFDTTTSIAPVSGRELLDHHQPLGGSSGADIGDHEVQAHGHPPTA
jgi:hypothetical protein